MLARVAALLPLPLLLLGLGCRENPAGPDPGVDPVEYNPDWTEGTHGQVPPNYPAVFPQDAVNVIEISMTAAQWAAVRADMVSLWGFDFGSIDGGVPGGAGGFPTEDPEYVAVTVRFNGRQWKDVGFRLKGNSTLQFAWRNGIYKLPFRLNFDHFEDQIPGIRNQRFFGFKELSWSPGWADNSLVREKVAADILRAAGIPAARTAFVRAYIDFGAGLKYCGVYTLVEVVDDTMVKDQFGEDGGNLYKPESRLQSFAAAEFEKKNHAAAGDFSDVQAFVAALNSPLRQADPGAWRTGLEATFDVDHFLKWLAVNNAIVNWDSYGGLAHNYYLYNHSARRLTWIPWDHNLSLNGSPGVTGSGPPARGEGLSLTMNEVPASWPLIRYLADDPVYFAAYRRHLGTFYRDVLTESAMLSLLDRYRALITPFVIGPDGEQPSYSFLPNTVAFVNANANLRKHVLARRSLLAGFLP